MDVFRRWSWNPRHVLFAGFGGLLALMMFGSVDALIMMRQAKVSNAEIRRTFLSRSHALEEIRGGIYVSGTLARDYLLAADAAAAESQRSKLRATRQQTETALENYSRSLSKDEAATFRSLQAEIHTYWKVLDLMLEPDREKRLRRDSTYFYNQLVVRRAAMLDLAARIASLNEQNVATADEKLAAMFDGFRMRLVVILSITLAGGFALAGVASSRLLRAQRELKELSARLVSAQEEERRLISRELHDEVGQSLTALSMEAAAAASMAPASDELRVRLESMKRLAENSVNSVRNMALLLRPSMLDDLGLIPALEWQAREVAKRTGMKVRVVASDIDEELPDAQKTCVYRVVQEALNNSARHARAHSVQVQVARSNGNLTLVVQDDGAGFDVQHASGLGLLGMEERVQRAGGQFRVESHPGKGTLLNVTLPLPHTAHERAT